MSNDTSGALGPPPAYEDVTGSMSGTEPSAGYSRPPPPSSAHPRPSVDLNAAFNRLRLSESPKDPDADTCLAHLKLLFAIQTMKQDIGYTDGLWDLWDTRADRDDEARLADLAKGDRDVESLQKDAEQKQIILSKIREKRWALFVARAVDRYEAWWKTLSEGRRLGESDLDENDNPYYLEFPNIGECKEWVDMMLPPLGMPLLPFSRLRCMLK